MTELQQKIVLYISRGYENKEIGSILLTSESNVKKQSMKIRAIFKVRNSMQLIRVLCEKGIMQQIEKQYL